MNELCKSSMQIEKASTLKTLTKRKIKNFKVLAFSTYILRKLITFFNVLPFPLYTRKKQFKKTLKKLKFHICTYFLPFLILLRIQENL